DSDLDESMEQSGLTPSPANQEHNGDELGSSHPPSEGCASPDPSGPDKGAGPIYTWPVKEGTTLGPFSARIEPTLGESNRENSICVRGTSGTAFSIFILEYYCDEILHGNNIRPVSKQGAKSAIVYMYKPDKQLYLLTLKDIAKQDAIYTMFLEASQDRHPRSDEVDDLIQSEVNAQKQLAAQPAQTPCTADEPHQSKTPEKHNSPPRSQIDAIKQPIEVPSVSCQACGVTFRNPANLSAHQLYYCAARETAPLPVPSRARQHSHPGTYRETPASNSLQLNGSSETRQPEDLVCILCKARFSNLTNCLNHMVKLHSEQNSQACRCCNFISGDIKLLKEHMLIHIRGSGINPNIFMASQGHSSHGPLSISGSDISRDARLEQKQQNNQDAHLSSPMDNISEQAEGSFVANRDDSMRDSEKKSSASHEVLRSDSSPSASETRRSPSGSLPHSSKDETNEGRSTFQPRPAGRFLCVECDITFSNHKNFIAHKQYYCQGHSKERKKPGQMLPSHPVPLHMPLAQCAGCAAMFPNGDKLAVHALYFCPSRTAAVSQQRASEESTEERSSPKTKSEEGRPGSEDSKNVKSDPTAESSEAPKVSGKVQKDGSSKSSTESRGSSPGKAEVVPSVLPIKVDGCPPAVGPRSVLLAPGYVPAYIGRQGSSPVYILASHMFMAPHGVAGSQKETAIPVYPHCANGSPTGKNFPRGENGTPFPGERPLDLSVRKRKGSDEVVQQEGSASKIIRGESLSEESSSPAPLHSLPSAASRPSHAVSTSPGHVQVQYKCPGCHISFHRFDSLSVHRQFYCQSENGSGSLPQTPTSPMVQMHPAIPSLPYHQVISGHSSTNGSALVPALATVQLQDDPVRPSSRCEKGRTSSKESSSANSYTEDMDTATAAGSKSPQPLEQKEKNKSSKSPNSSVLEQPAIKQEQSDEEGNAPQNNDVPNVSPASTDPVRNTLELLSQVNTNTSTLHGHSMPMYVPPVLRYVCPSCGVSFMKFESLSAHQQFYCRASQAALVRDMSSPKGREVKKGYRLSDTEPSDGAECMSTSHSTGSSPQANERCHTGGSGTMKTDAAQTESMDTAEPFNAAGAEAALQEHPHSSTNTIVGTTSRVGSVSNPCEMMNDASSDNTTSSGMIRDASNGEDRQSPVRVKQEIIDSDSGSCTKSPMDAKMHRVEDNNNFFHVKQEKLDDDDKADSCSSANHLPQRSPLGERQPSRNPVPLTIQNGQCRRSGEGQSPDRHSCPPQKPDECTNPRLPSSGGEVQSVTNGSLANGRPPHVVMKHCRTCNISFSSLSTFIAHKKYYCASHHVAKNCVQ
ncbi:uncharacterized protein, partial [Diadema antillarum]|uniref:uncharacterized protein n=1 Tax=Diadema antillarum TaxID=105358 RepID=UPI003A8BB1F8